MWVSEIMMVVVVADSGDDGRAAVKMNQRMTLFRARPADLALLKKIRQSTQQYVVKLIRYIPYLARCGMLRRGMCGMEVCRGMAAE